MSDSFQRPGAPSNSANNADDTPKRQLNKNKPLPPDVTSFNSLFKSSSTSQSHQHHFTKTDENAYVMHGESNPRPHSESEEAGTDRAQRSDNRNDRTNTSQQGATQLLPDISDFEQIHQTASLVPVHHFADIPAVVKEVATKQGQNTANRSFESYLFRTQLGKEQSLDILMQKDADKQLSIQLYADGELKDLLMQNKIALIDHLRKNGFDIADIEIEVPPSRGQGESNSDQSQDGGKPSKSDEDSEEVFVL